jgi:glycosyltransferase involved in cell wall biosynthesis
MKINNNPLVSVICTAFNHESFIEKALNSVVNQSYEFVELIVIDNASTDTTKEIIKEFGRKYPFIKSILNSTNRGLCKAFNQGLAVATGEYVIDLSGDDVLLPDRIEKQVAFFKELPDDFGVIFSNAQYVSAKGRLMNYHYEVDKQGKAKSKVPSGDVYRCILEYYFICTPTMMMRRFILNRLGGYDESLTYEDFDFWLRSSILCKYSYQDEVLTHKRVVNNSLSSLVFKPGSGMLESTYAVCNKAYDLNRNQEDFEVLAKRIRTFIRKCLYAQEFELGIRFRKLLNYIEDPGLTTDFIVLLCRMRLPVNRLYRFYLTKRLKYLTKREDFKVNFVLLE